MSLGIGVAHWYQPTRPEAPETPSELYSALVLRVFSA